MSCLFAYGSQWIATGYALAMTRRERNGSVRYAHNSTHMSLRGENEVKDVAIHCMQWTCTVRTERAVRLLVHSGSPRAFSPRDDKVKSKIKRCSFLNQ